MPSYACAGSAVLLGPGTGPLVSFGATVTPPIPVVLVTFKLYADGSRMEWMPCGADQRSAYQQTVISSPMHPQIGGGSE